MLIFQYLFNINKITNIETIIKLQYYEIFKYMLSSVSSYNHIDIIRLFKITLKYNNLDAIKYLIRDPTLLDPAGFGSPNPLGVFLGIDIHFEDEYA